jgi:NRPS condensation-like uncharacterized protein
MYREGRTPFSSIFTIKLLGSLSHERLQIALRTLQANHPLLRCAVEDVEGRPHFVLQHQPLPIPLRMVERRDENSWQDEVQREWTVAVGAADEPLARLVWIRASHVSELILVVHHCICDGQSGMRLLQELLHACDDLSQETIDEFDTVEDLVPAALLHDPRFHRRVRWKMRLLRLGLRLKRVHTGQTHAPITSEKMYFQRRRLDKNVSLAITDRCKAEGVTVLAAAAVAFAQAFREIRGIAAVRKAYTMVNVRRFLPQLQPGVLFGIAPGVELSLGKIPTKETTEAGFWKSSRAIKTDMTRRIDRLGAGLYEYLVGLESLHDKYHRLVGDTESASPVHHVTLSNMGRLDLPTQYRTFTLETVFSPLVMVSPTPANTVILSSFADQLEFAIVSDTQSLPYAHATVIQQHAISTLRRCAGMVEQPGTGTR